MPELFPLIVKAGIKKTDKGVSIVKEQTFQNIDDFKPDEWNPIDVKTFCFRVNKELYGWFGFDESWGIWRGKLQEIVYYDITPEMDNKDVSDVMNNVRKRLEKWGLIPEQITWQWGGSKYHATDYHGILRSIIDPEPYMIYKTCEMVDKCEIKTSYHLERMTRAVYLDIEKTIRNDDVDLNKLWNVYVEQMRMRVHEPFTATLGTREDMTVDE